MGALLNAQLVGFELFQLVPSILRCTRASGRKCVRSSVSVKDGSGVLCKEKQGVGGDNELCCVGIYSRIIHSSVRHHSFIPRNAGSQDSAEKSSKQSTVGEGFRGVIDNHWKSYQLIKFKVFVNGILNCDIVCTLAGIFSLLPFILMNSTPQIMQVTGEVGMTATVDDGINCIRHWNNNFGYGDRDTGREWYCCSRGAGTWMSQSRSCQRLPYSPSVSQTLWISGCRRGHFFRLVSLTRLVKLFVVVLAKFSLMCCVLRLCIHRLLKLVRYILICWPGRVCWGVKRNLF